MEPTGKQLSQHTEPDLSVAIGDVRLDTCILNASGPKTETLPLLRQIGQSQSSAIVMKSCTLEPRMGNPEPRYLDLPDKSSINSMGLPNVGYTEYIKFASILRREFGKPVLASVSGMTLDENLVILRAFNTSDAGLVEFNPGSPNTIGKPIIGYDMQEMDRLLDAVTTVSTKPIGVKLPPYFDFVQFEEIAAVLRKYPLDFITCINSIGNGLAIDPETETTLIRPKGGFGGLGGPAIKYTALANVRKLYELLGDRAMIIGVGGISTGVDAFEFILAGASAVQLGTIYHQEGPNCFARVAAELRAYMHQKGYSSVNEFCGKLQTL
jgi:dihydroorotate dehydrogenase (fumarate)